MRAKLGDDGYRLETIVLPLIDNSIYSDMARAFGGDVEPLDTLPVPQQHLHREP
ncbi:MAG: hypothetical protein R3B90_00480 [Planctomycetaceae bacterium]